MKNKNFEHIAKRESGLKKSLTEGQMSMIALGGAIGTGLFAGSQFAISMAGPSVILSFIIAGFIGLLLMGSLAEMTVHHPTSGSFGSYAEHYLGRGVGFMLRYCYVGGVIMAVGAEVSAISSYMKFWYPNVHPVIWQVVFSAVVLLANLASVKVFGSLEYFFSMTKLFVISAFIIIAIAHMFMHSDTATVANHLSGEGGFAPYGFTGIWQGAVAAIFSYFGIEFIAVAAGEAQNPRETVKKAFKSTVFRLVFFYLLTITLIVMVVPWKSLLTENAASPFVTVMQAINIPFAADILNMVVIIASLSAMNGMLYITSRMLFSLSRGGDAPKFVGHVAKNGVPVYALLISMLGIATSVVVTSLIDDVSFSSEPGHTPLTPLSVMMAITTFGLLATWGMIFVTHLAFRRHVRLNNEELGFKTIGYPVSSILGVVAIVAILISTLYIRPLHAALYAGIPYVILVALAYLIRRRFGRSADGESDSDPD